MYAVRPHGLFRDHAGVRLLVYNENIKITVCLQDQPSIRGHNYDFKYKKNLCSTKRK